MEAIILVSYVYVACAIPMFVMGWWMGKLVEVGIASAIVLLMMGYITFVTHIYRYCQSIGV